MIQRIRLFQRSIVKRWNSFSASAKTRILLILLISLLGFGLRFYSIPRMPIEADERVYLISALKYSAYMRDGQWKMLVYDEYNYQHPPLQKIIFGIALLTRPPLETLGDYDFYNGPSMYKVPAAPWGMTARTVSVIFGGLTTLFLTAVNPIAGLFYAIHTRAIEFNTYITLEALPSLASLLCVLCYIQWLKRTDQKIDTSNKPMIWLGLSAGFLGMAAAGKYNYAVVGLVILVHFAGRIMLKKNPPIDLWKVFVWGILALVMFYVFDPFIWKHPFIKLRESLYFHVEYSQSEKAQVGNYPFYQPLVWLSKPVTEFRANHKASGSFLITPDTFIALLALVGLPQLFKRQPVFFAWLIIGLFVLFIYSTKWPQYILTILVPVCMSAAMGTSWLFNLLKKGLRLSGNSQ